MAWLSLPELQLWGVLKSQASCPSWGSLQAPGVGKVPTPTLIPAPGLRSPPEAIWLPYRPSPCPPALGASAWVPCDKDSVSTWKSNCWHTLLFPWRKSVQTNPLKPRTANAADYGGSRLGFWSPLWSSSVSFSRLQMPAMPTTPSILPTQPGPSTRIWTSEVWAKFYPPSLLLGDLGDTANPSYVKLQGLGASIYPSISEGRSPLDREYFHRNFCIPALIHSFIHSTVFISINYVPAQVGNDKLRKEKNKTRQRRWQRQARWIYYYVSGDIYTMSTSLWVFNAPLLIALVSTKREKISWFTNGKTNSHRPVVISF